MCWYPVPRYDTYSSTSACGPPCDKSTHTSGPIASVICHNMLTSWSTLQVKRLRMVKQTRRNRFLSQNRKNPEKLATLLKFYPTLCMSFDPNKSFAEDTGVIALQTALNVEQAKHQSEPNRATTSRHCSLGQRQQWTGKRAGG